MEIWVQGTSINDDILTTVIAMSSKLSFVSDPGVSYLRSASMDYVVGKLVRFQVGSNPRSFTVFNARWDSGAESWAESRVVSEGQNCDTTHRAE